MGVGSSGVCVESAGSTSKSQVNTIGPSVQADAPVIPAPMIANRFRGTYPTSSKKSPQGGEGSEASTTASARLADKVDVPRSTSISKWSMGTPEYSSSLRKGASALLALKKVLATSTLNWKTRQDLVFTLEMLEGVLSKARIEKKPYLELSEEARMYLQRFLKSGGNLVRTPPKLRTVAWAARAAVRWYKGKSREADVGKGDLGLPILNDWFIIHLDTWSSFDVFQSDYITGGRPLQALALAVCTRQGLLKALHIDAQKLKNCFAAIEGLYLEPPYHSKYHAADVVQSSHVFAVSGLGRALNDLERLAIVVAAACHDAGHPGVTNDFRIAASDEEAIRYNDLSVNENMSLAITFKELRQPSNDLCSTFMVEQKAKLRKRVIGMVLATDMAVHFDNHKRLEGLITLHGTDTSLWEDSQQVLETIVHSADLSNVYRPHHLALQWTDRVLAEFFAQGDQERALGRPISPLCDRKAVSRAQSQIGFIDFIARPMIRTISPLCHLGEAMDNMARLYRFWTDELAKERNAAEGNAAT